MKHIFPSFEDIPVKGRLKICLDLVEKENLKDKILVDVGCSGGWLAFKLQKEKLKRIIGVDTNKNAISFARKNVDNADFYTSSDDRLPVHDSTIDIVTMFDVIEHVARNRELKVLKEVARVLKKKGKLFLSTPNSHIITNLSDPAWYLGHRHYKKVKIKKFIEQAGFKVLEIKIKGNLWSIVYMLWFYFTKWVLGKSLPRSKWLENKDDRGYIKEGFFTLFIVAEKI